MTCRLANSAFSRRAFSSEKASISVVESYERISHKLRRYFSSLAEKLNFTNDGDTFGADEVAASLD